MDEREIQATRIFYENYESRSRINVNVGGARSSKSYSLAQLFVLRHQTYNNWTQVITRKTFPALKATAMEDVISIMQDWGCYSRKGHNKTDATLVNPEKGNIIRFLSIDDPTRIRSMKANAIWMEEANEFTWTDYITLKTRLSCPTTPDRPNQMFLSLNPSDPQGWIKTRLVDPTKQEAGEDAGAVNVILSSYKDNPFLDAEYINDLEALKEDDETYYQIFARGVWAQAKAIIYSNFDVLPASKFPTQFDQVFAGQDFGFNNPSACLFIGIKDRDAWIRQIIYESRLTNPQLIDRIKDEWPKKVPSVPIRKVLFRADAAEPDRIAEFEAAGFQIEAAPKGPNVVRDGIDFCKRFKIHFCDEDTATVKEARSFKWREKDGLVLDEPVKFMDHSMDAMRYGMTGQKEFSEPQGVLIRKGSPVQHGTRVARRARGFGGLGRGYGSSRF